MNANVPAPPLGGSLPPGLSLERLLRRPAKWTSQGGWIDYDGVPLPSPLFVIAYPTALEMWRKEEDRNVVEHKFDYPLPDPEELNAAIPVTEWKTGISGAPEKPWKSIFIVVMLNMTTGAIYAYKNSTYGARQMHEQLVERIAVKQMLSGGKRVYPIVRLEQRPWHSSTFGAPATAPATPSSTILEHTRPAPKPITVAEMVADEIPEDKWK